MYTVRDNNWKIILKLKISILNQLINKGGIYGYAAKLYFKDEVRSKELIFECYEQCHVKQAKINWGKNLIKDIKQYCKLNYVKLKKPDFAWKACKALPAKK